MSRRRALVSAVHTTDTSGAAALKHTSHTAQRVIHGSLCSRRDTWCADVSVCAVACLLCGVLFLKSKGVSVHCDCTRVRAVDSAEVSQPLKKRDRAESACLATGSRYTHRVPETADLSTCVTSCPCTPHDFATLWGETQSRFQRHCDRATRNLRTRALRSCLTRGVKRVARISTSQKKSLRLSDVGRSLRLPNIGRGRERNMDVSEMCSVRTSVSLARAPLSTFPALQCALPVNFLALFSKIQNN